MKKSLDLHGFNKNQAIPKLTFALEEFENNTTIDLLEIIPGKGTGVMSQVVGDFLDGEGITYSNDKHGNYIIKKY